MTFDQIVTKVKEYTGLSSAEAVTRIGNSINANYRRVTASLGLDATRYVRRSTSMTIGQQTVTFSNIEKIDRILDTTDASSSVLLREVSLDEIESAQPSDGPPSKWAKRTVTADTVTAIFDTVPQDTYSVSADGWATVADLSGSDEPAFPESFHDILAWYTIEDELLKKEKDKLALAYKAKGDALLSDLRFHLADTQVVTQQGSSPFSGATGGGSGTGSTGGTSYTQTGLITFDRDPDAPFAVTDTSAYVPNLYTEGVGNVTTDRLIGRDTTGTGESEQLTVGGGVEFTGSGGIQRSALTGDVTASAGSNATTIAADAVTTTKILNDNVTDAKLRNSSACSVIGRSANSTGDPADIAAASNGQVLKRTTNALAFAAVDLTADVGSSILPVANGGTGVASLTANRIPYGNGTSAFQSASAFTFDGTTLTTPGQIAFPATQNASSGANTLDDYEEDSWTPADGSGASLTLTSVVGHYIKIGQLVLAWFTLTYPATADATAAKISGLPFTSITSAALGAAAIAFTNYSATVATMQVTSGATTATFNSTGGAALTNANLSGRTFTGVFTYRASA